MEGSLHISCKKGIGGPDSMSNCVRTTWKAPKINLRPSFGELRPIDCVDNKVKISDSKLKTKISSSFSNLSFIIDSLSGDKIYVF